MSDQYERMMQESRQLATRMRSKHETYSDGTGAAALLAADNAPTHHMDGTFPSIQLSNDFRRISPSISANAENMRR